jgi:peptide/nickel transport system substrate-binding protein
MKHRKLTRRQFISRTAIGGTGLVLAACGEPAPAVVQPTAVPAPTTAPEPTTVAAAEPTATTAAAEPTTAPAEATAAPAEATTAPSGGGTASEREAPMLAQRVADGSLPPLEERLPKDPMTLTPIQETGTYGGEMKWIIDGPDLGSYEHTFLYEAPYRWSADASKIEPNLAVSHEYADDGMSMTLTFREGVRWSDGEPFTADDIAFWWNDLVLDPESSFTPPYWTLTGDEPMKMEVVNPTTVKMTFNEPHWLFHNLMASTSDYMRMYAPKHYLQQFHPKYNQEVKDYTEFLKRFPSTGNLYTDPALPVLSAWHTIEYTPGQRLVAERNPYYWKLDSDGKQLPYIDTLAITQVEDPRVIPLRIVSGEVDFMARNIPLDAFTTLKTSEAQGNYRMIQWKVGAGADPAVILNYDNLDPTMQSIGRNRDVRLALSHAIDRKTINDVVYFGLGAVSQAVTSPYSPWGRTTEEGKQLMEQWRNLAVEYDVEKANQLLDGAGLDKRDGEGFRLRPDGKRLSWVIITGSDPDSRAVDVLEFVVENWKAVGVEATINSMDWESGFWPKFSTGEYDVAGWDAWTGYDLPSIPDCIFPIGSAYWGTPLTAQWFNTQGKEGNKPEPGDAMDKMIGFYKNMLAEKTEEGRNKWVLEAVKIHISEGPFFLGAVNDVPNLVVARPNMRNVPDFAFTGSWAQGAPGATNPPTYYYQEA